MGRNTISQAGGNEASGGYSNINIGLVEIETVERLTERSQGAYFINGTQWATAREGKPEF